MEVTRDFKNKGNIQIGPESKVHSNTSMRENFLGHRLDSNVLFLYLVKTNWDFHYHIQSHKCNYVASVASFMPV